jgi:hypothetical protein
VAWGQLDERGPAPLLLPAHQLPCLPVKRRESVLPGRIDGQPACRRCSGVKLNLDCKTCGAEDELYRGSRCWSCELAALVDQLLTNPDTGVMAAELVPVAAALKSMKRSNSGVTWIRQGYHDRIGTQRREILGRL